MKVTGVPKTLTLIHESEIRSDLRDGLAVRVLEEASGMSLLVVELVAALGGLEVGLQARGLGAHGG